MPHDCSAADGNEKPRRLLGKLIAFKAERSYGTTCSSSLLLGPVPLYSFSGQMDQRVNRTEDRRQSFRALPSKQGLQPCRCGMKSRNPESQYANRSSRISPGRRSVERRPCETRGASLGDGRARTNSDPRARAESGHHTRLREHQYGLLWTADKTCFAA
jgi:hypothetical protein